MSFAASGLATDVDAQRRLNNRSSMLVYMGVLGVCAVLGLLTVRSAPHPFALPLTLLLFTLLVVVIKPVAGVYLVVFLSLVTDPVVSPWYPFTKNLSSSESILYLGNAFAISPLEMVLAATTVAWILRLLTDRASARLVRGRLFVPMAMFTAFLFFGFAYGLGTGGDRYAAMWEFRPILYLPLTYLLITNLFTNRRQYHRLAALMLLAIVIQALLGLEVYRTLNAFERKNLESLIAHGSAVQMSVVILLGAFAVWVLPRASGRARLATLLATVPVATVWLISQRRAAMIGLAVAVIALFILLSKLGPRRLAVVAPVVTIVAVGYLAAFWGAQDSTIGFPAQAIKSVISPGAVSDKDQSSDEYRAIENFDISTTIHSKPLTGIGFGQKFYRPVPLPDISFFPFYEYIPHNSVLWIWIKMGVGGFVAMLFLWGSAIRQGARTLVTLPRAFGKDVTLVFAALSYVVMYLVFAYVDIAWDTRSMLTLAVAMAVCADFINLPPDRVPAVASQHRATWATPPRSALVRA